MVQASDYCFGRNASAYGERSAGALPAIGGGSRQIALPQAQARRCARKGTRRDRPYWHHNTPGHGVHLGPKEHKQQVPRANVTLYNYGLDFLANAHAGE
jgi:hypothetical protein